LGNGGHTKTVRASALAALVLITIMNIVPPFATIAKNKLAAAIPWLARDFGKVR
jgi:hypothetical protein